jgi:hypothetical protein
VVNRVTCSIPVPSSILYVHACHPRGALPAHWACGMFSGPWGIVMVRASWPGHLTIIKKKKGTTLLFLDKLGHALKKTKIKRCRVFTVHEYGMQPLTKYYKLDRCIFFFYFYFNTQTFFLNLIFLRLNWYPITSYLLRKNTIEKMRTKMKQIGKISGRFQNSRKNSNLVLKLLY